MTEIKDVAHTPGPWQIGRVLSKRLFHPDLSVEIQDARGSMVAVTFKVNFEMDGGVDAANARLMAAGPDLLHALKEINDAACYASEVNTDARAEMLLQIGALARVAISKAEGRHE